MRPAWHSRVVLPSFPPAEILGLLDERRDGAQTLRRVTALFSATLHSGVERLAGLSLRKPMHIGEAIMGGWRGTMQDWWFPLEG